jgi:hypothetical protein
MKIVTIFVQFSPSAACLFVKTFLCISQLRKVIFWFCKVPQIPENIFLKVIRIQCLVGCLVGWLSDKYIIKTM